MSLFIFLFFSILSVHGLGVTFQRLAFEDLSTTFTFQGCYEMHPVHQKYNEMIDDLTEYPPSEKLGIFVVVPGI